MTDRERLGKAIRDLHGVDSSHLRSEPVHETFQGETVWEGVVEVLLGVPPINSAQDAVKAAVMAPIEKQQKHRGGT